jgi:phosphopantothenoylcysteine decarboxylase/phosphopantothenate--cysteine ligase
MGCSIVPHLFWDDFGNKRSIMTTAQRVLIGVGGGIAAYKICEVVSTLAKSGVEVRVITTAAAEQFVSPLTFATLSRHPAYGDRHFWEATHGRPLHIELGEWANLFILAPLTANTLGKLAYGLADNLLTNTVLASTCPLLIAPAMNTDMWQQATVQRNWQQLQTDPRIHTVGPGSGRLACDRVGAGRMAEPTDIVTMARSLLITQGQQDLAGKRILVSAGGTREFLDPVRFIGNPSTGKMGVAIALAAHHRGAAVTLVHGPLDDSILAQVGELRRSPITTATEMQAALTSELPSTDWIIMTAAVADVKPAHTHTTKLAKAELPEALPLAPVPDIIATLSKQKRPHQKLIGFAAQTGDIIPPAQAKLQRKGLDAIVANPIDQPNSGFGSDQNQAVILDRTGQTAAIAPCSKLELAHRVLDFALTLS